MRAALSPHPDFPGPGVAGLEVDVERSSGALHLTYRLAGELGRLVIPAATPSERTDELWRHTCFEAFVRPGAGEGYLELNFAPSTNWAAYRFAGYRDGMAPAAIAAPRLEVETTAHRLTLVASVDLSSLPDFAAGPWRLALAAVIEDVAGARGYWALAHPNGRPDFHHAAGFVLQLPPT